MLNTVYSIYDPHQIFRKNKTESYNGVESLNVVEKTLHTDKQQTTDFTKANNLAVEDTKK